MRARSGGGHAKAALCRDPGLDYLRLEIEAGARGVGNDQEAVAQLPAVEHGAG